MCAPNSSAARHLQRGTQERLSRFRRRVTEKHRFRGAFLLLFLLLAAGQLAVFRVEHERAAGGQVAAQDLFRDQRLRRALEVALERACAVDRIEAALDDVNVQRFAKYIRRLTDSTQFIVITHRRGTMEEADMLYGVTMQEQGVSKMLMLNLAEAEKRLKNTIK